MAWIDNANRTGDTLLGMAAKTVPEDIIDDLMDVCKHHAKLPITECPISFRFDPTERKQLVASLLRFSDELDIDAHRISIDTVKNFSLDPRNSVYWWLHNHTKVIFSARSVIILTIRLNPSDVKQHGSFVHAAFITEFQTKNHPVLTILGQNGIPIVISAESKVVEHDRAEPLPSEIVQALQTMQTRRDPLPVLADEVRTWLQAIRYEVSEPRQLNDRFMDMIATLDQGTVRQRVLVRCVDGEITPADVDALDVALDRKTPQGWLISDRRVSDQARQRTTEDDALQVFNLSGFLRQMVWRPYFDVLTALVEKDRIPELYVDLACYRQEMDVQGHEINRDKHASLDKYIDNWLKERGKMHISLLGEFGTGKTWFCRHYTYRQLERYLQDPVNERLPLLITLRMFAKAMTPQQLINDALLEQYKLPFVGSAFEIFQEMNRRGKLLLILDGFDEMARQVDYQTVVDNFWQLANLVDENSKVIITSRTEYFRWAKESEKILGGEEYGRRTIVLQPPKFEVLYLEPFNDDQIRKVIIGRLGKEKGTTTADRILNTPNLAEMARKPVLIELLLAALDEVGDNVLKNPAQVYLYATNKLLLRNIDTQRTFTSTANKLYFLCELAWEMIKNEELRIHYTAIPERIKSYFGDRIKDQHELDTWDFDLRNQTLLHRDAAGYYEFAHKSLAEYFVAIKFSAELGYLDPTFVQTYCEADGRTCQLPIVQKDIIGLAETFGAISLTNKRMFAVRYLLNEMLSKNAKERLWKIIYETRGKSQEQVKYAGGNAATLLNIQKELFVNKDLSQAILDGADLSGVDLTMVDLKGASLYEAGLNGCILEKTDLRNSDLSDIDIKEPQEIWSIAWSPDERYLACDIGIFPFPSFSVLLILDAATGDHKKVLHRKESLHDLCWSSNGDLLAGLIYNEVIVWRVRDNYTSTTFRIERSLGWMSTRSSGFRLSRGKISFDKSSFQLSSDEIELMRERIEEEESQQYKDERNLWKSILRNYNCNPTSIRIDDSNTLYFRDDFVLVSNSQKMKSKAKPVFPTELSFVKDLPENIVSVNKSPSGRLIAIGGQDATISIFDISPSSPTFGKCLKVLTITMNYQGLKISGARGLEKETFRWIKGKGKKGTLLELFAKYGAVLDEKQKETLEELKKTEVNRLSENAKFKKSDVDTDGLMTRIFKTPIL
ncbi:MAG: pentapeptide repeat-containing protein [Candidatus Brocadiaceae bacterium]|nr:pentapeptide repeat-containing protein [Candidatus Brocadiaceae bacterium]